MRRSIDMETIKYKVIYADNGIIQESDDSIFIYEDDGTSNPKVCKALGEDVYSCTYESVMRGEATEFEIEISITPLK
jgi:hypothetical protein